MKYPRTPHLPWSPGATSDDKWISDVDLELLKSSGIELITTEKLDGGNISMSRDKFHARSEESTIGPWDFRAKARWQEFAHEIPENFIISAESLYARRSVAYENLPDVFLVFGIWEDLKNGDFKALSWDEVVEWTNLLELHTVPELYRGTNFHAATSEWARFFGSDEYFGADAEKSAEKSEGYVIRNAGSFLHKDFAKNVAKYVRENHVRTAADWRHRDDFELNGLAIK